MKKIVAIIGGLLFVSGLIGGIIIVNHKLQVAYNRDIYVENCQDKVCLSVAVKRNSKYAARWQQFLSSQGFKPQRDKKEQRIFYTFSRWKDKEKLLQQLGIHRVTSSHFNYYTRRDTGKIAKLEARYKKLRRDILGFYDCRKLKEKIEYIALPSARNGGYPYAVLDRQVIVDPQDCCSSHELIHVLVPVENDAFNEGVATALAKDRNQTNKEDNANLIAKEYLTEGEVLDVPLIIEIGTSGEGKYYAAMGSFVYYNLYIMDNRSQFTNFLKSLNNRHDLDETKAKYSKFMEQDLESAVKEWKEWLAEIKETDDIYVNW